MAASQICLSIVIGGNLKAQSLSAVENTVDMVSCSRQNFSDNQDFKIQDEAIVSDELVSNSNKIGITDEADVEKINDNSFRFKKNKLAINKARISDQNSTDINFKNSPVHNNSIEYPLIKIFRDKIYCGPLEVKPPPEIII